MREGNKHGENTHTLYFPRDRTGSRIPLQGMLQRQNRGVTGWVRNCSDGTVEMEAEGYAADIAAVIRELDEHSWGNIERIESENIPTEGGYGFEIR